MANLTLAVSDELHKKMKRMSDIRWSEVARRAIERKIAETIISREEREAINWAVKLQKSSRSGRLEKLKKKGLI